MILVKTVRHFYCLAQSAVNPPVTERRNETKYLLAKEFCFQMSHKYLDKCSSSSNVHPQEIVLLIVVQTKFCHDNRPPSGK